MVQNLCQILANMAQNQGLERVWAPFGSLWGALWASPGSTVPLGFHLDASWADLGRFLDRLGHQFGLSWSVLEAAWRRPVRIFMFYIVIIDLLF